MKCWLNYNRFLFENYWEAVFDFDDEEKMKKILNDAVSSYCDSHSVTKTEAKKQIINLFSWLEYIEP